MSRFLKRNPTWIVAGLVILTVVVYWGFLASDRYVSRAHIVLQSPEIIPSGLNVSSILSGTSGSGDLLLLREHLQSVSMLQKLQGSMNLREHYSNPEIDRWSRLESADVPIEAFHDYMNKRVAITFDDYSKVLRIEVQAYDPETAQAITQALLDEGERHMNLMGQRLAQEQVAFIDKQVQTLEERLLSAREALLHYQNEKGLVAPTQTVEAIFSTVSRLEAELAVLRAQIKSQKTYQSIQSPTVRRMQSEADALAQQIEIEKAKLATTGGNALNRVSAEYETLQLKAKFALDLYSSALTSLESTRVEAARKLKQVSILEYPTLAQYPEKPERLYNIAVVTVFALLFATIGQLVIAVIRDHRD
ncbi:Capsular polysaccharide export system inner membrane protein KpsE, polysaccharide copolymerases PCP familly [Marinobacter nauticus ATCC 49840]|uniref:chain-length determining protein n=1 Tax=Marinobacter nauticus TaxID=2743 RepID=UPI000256EA25|nr:chain-length determining protein [Marinobacter nauticus]CCG96016.1 Capsular polysaccharide export system inner membrane protein KpsE, polysaccharide copolymerases PCP familly [Marinobacter nauticus ATCC 49840]